MEDGRNKLESQQKLGKFNIPLTRKSKAIKYLFSKSNLYDISLNIFAADTWNSFILHGKVHCVLVRQLNRWKLADSAKDACVKTTCIPCPPRGRRRSSTQLSLRRSKTVGSSFFGAGHRRTTPSIFEEDAPIFEESLHLLFSVPKNEELPHFPHLPNFKTEERRCLPIFNLRSSAAKEGTNLQFSILGREDRSADRTEDGDVCLPCIGNRKRRVVLWSHRCCLRPAPSRLASLRPAALPAVRRPFRSARGISGFWIRQIVLNAERVFFPRGEVKCIERFGWSR